MSSVTPDRLRPAQRQGGEWRGDYQPALRRESGGPPWGLLVGGLVVVGLGVLAWNYLGPDLKRYMKIRNM
jgi:hypothetical protein